MRCPVCGSRNVKKLKTGSYKCNECGFVFYPERDAIIDLRDLVDTNTISDEDIEGIGESVKIHADELGRELFGENTKNIFARLDSPDELVDRYGDEEKVYGVFITFKGDVEGTMLLIVPEQNVEDVISENRGLFESLREVAEKSFKMFSRATKLKAEPVEIDIAYDDMVNIINFLTSEIGDSKELALFNYRFSGNDKNYGEVIFVPSKNSLGVLRRVS